MELSFCRRCGQPLHHRQDNVYRCPRDHTIYLNPAPTVGVFFVTPDNKVILARRGIEPHKGMLDAFGGFVDLGESFEEAATRELKEETSLQPEDYEPLQYITSGVGNYPYQGEAYSILSVLFWTRRKNDRPLKPTDDVAEIVTAPLATLDLNLLHDEDIKKGIRELRKIIQNKESL